MTVSQWLGVGILVVMCGAFVYYGGRTMGYRYTLGLIAGMSLVSLIGVTAISLVFPGSAQS